MEADFICKIVFAYKHLPTVNWKKNSNLVLIHFGPSILIYYSRFGPI